MIETLQQIWTTLSAIHEELIGLAFTLLGALLVYFFRARVKLVYGRAANSRNVIPVPDSVEQGKHSNTEIYVEKFFLQNLGRKTATNVEFVLSDFPADISVWQPRDVAYKSIEKGHCLITIPQIAPQELVVIDCVYLNQRASYVASVKCAEILGKEVPFFTVRMFPKWVYWSMTVLMVLGFSFVVQTLLKLLGA